MAPSAVLGGALFSIRGSCEFQLDPGSGVAAYLQLVADEMA
jgi:hypothetical protein